MLLRLIDDITDQVNTWQKLGLFLTIDYCQAFDRKSKDFDTYVKKKKKKNDLDLILRNGLVFLWQTPKAVLPTAVGYPNIFP